ncbi:hypothetical protein TIFTF001_041620 [Ficus carica]|uniref:Uncharacterized protein n=1 Tax=Ficus carica TaxID=3494 RepID=A0AA88CVA0_FICCA|nr:hypothetical protein TIFTF001_041620 [Ficus carica]
MTRNSSDGTVTIKNQLDIARVINLLGICRNTPISQTRSTAPTKGEAEANFAHQTKPSHPTNFQRLPNPGKVHQNKQRAGGETSYNQKTEQVKAQSRGNPKNQPKKTEPLDAGMV